jgi:hypothetical protein
MTLILNGTTGVSGVDGSAATPAFQGNDSNTGISFGTDIVTINTGGVARVTTDASGNVGIGTATPTSRITIGSGTFSAAASGNTGLYTASSGANTGYLTVLTDGLDISTRGGSGRLILDSSGNVGIGTSSPSSKLTVVSTGAAQSIITGTDAGNGYLQFVGAAGVRLGYMGYGDSSSQMYVFNDKNAALIFGANGAERMRLIATGELAIGKSVSTATGAGIVLDDAGLIRITRDGTTAATFIQINNNGGTAVGTITASGSATQYNTSSDYRLKENVAPMTGALEKVAALNPVTYTWKNDGSVGQGFIAHELQAVVPEAVTGEKDAVYGDGKPQYQGVDTSFLVATLVAAIQELKAEVDALKGAQNV